MRVRVSPTQECGMLGARDSKQVRAEKRRVIAGLQIWPSKFWPTHADSPTSRNLLSCFSCMFSAVIWRTCLMASCRMVGLSVLGSSLPGSISWASSENLAVGSAGHLKH